MTDAEVLREFLRREQRWGRTLQALNLFHQSHLGKLTTQIQWIGGRELGRLSWLGFSWHEEMFWFGYGLREGTWLPLIEADQRSKYSSVWQSIEAQLGRQWEAITTEGKLYRRLWAPASLAGSEHDELEWFKARSKELHEYLVTPEA